MTLTAVTLAAAVLVARAVAVTAQMAPADDLLGWIQYGVLGLVVVGFLLGKIVPGRIYDQAIAENQKLRDELADRNAKTETQILPAALRLTDVATRMGELLERSERDRA
jgi:hypothetical protein